MQSFTEFNELNESAGMNSKFKKYGIIISKSGNGFGATIEVAEGNGKTFKTIKNGQTNVFSKGDLEFLLGKLKDGFKVSELALAD